MENETISFTIKLHELIYRRLKLISLLERKSMTELITTWINTAPIVIPDDLANPVDNPIVRKPYKTKQSNKPKPTNQDNEKTKQNILQYRKDKLSYQAITDKLIADDVPTFSGTGTWNKGTVCALFKTWTETK